MRTPIRTTLVALAAGAGLIGLSACHAASGGGGGTPSAATGSSTAPASASGSTVTVKNFMFMPMTLTVAKGTTVTWKFEDSTDHNVDFTGALKLKSPDLDNGKTYSHKFTTAGTFSYICGIHQYMTAKIIVK